MESNKQQQNDDYVVLQEEMEFDDLIYSMLIITSSDEEEETKKFGGSKKGKSPNKKSDFVEAYNRVVRNFNGRDSVYNEQDFEQRFRMPRAVFNRLNDALMGTHPFIHYKDATKKKGIYPLVKLVALLRFLAYGDAYDREDENLGISESALKPSYCAGLHEASNPALWSPLLESISQCGHQRWPFCSWGYFL
jgi:hypothetical protein